MLRVASTPRSVLALAATVLVLLGACGEDAATMAPGCVDRDRDGFGMGCIAPDCDDTNPLRTNNCESVPPPDCDADPLAPGCPCYVGSTRVCFPGDEDLIGVGLCRAGRARCNNRHWGVCSEAIGPTLEACNDLDDDCDGRIDESAHSPCGGCNARCLGGVWGEGDAPFSAGEGVDVTNTGALTLARRTRTFTTLWAANSGEDTISKIDTESAREIARYATGGSEPSRIAVDYLGDVWVANRAFEGQASVTKIAGTRERCVDRDGDGLETSSGPGDLLPSGTDECVLFTVPVGNTNAVARALAIDGDRGLDGVSGGDAWVGLYEAGEVVELDGVTGDVLTRVPVPGFKPYDALFDPWGMLWVVERDGHVVSIDRSTTPPAVASRPIPYSCYLLYSLAIDRGGSLFMTGMTCEHVLRFDPDTERWRRLPLPFSITRGIAIDEERHEAWASDSAGGAWRIGLEPLSDLGYVSLEGMGYMPRDAIGAAVDSHGNAWFVSSLSAPDANGVATRVHIEDQTVTAQVPIGYAPHTHGDLAGTRLLGGFVPSATTSHVFTGCVDSGPTRWLALHMAAQLGPGATARVEIRHAATVEGLAASTFDVLGTLPMADLPFVLTSVPQGGVLEVRLTLQTTAEDGAPRVTRVGVEWSCGGPD